MTLRLFVDLPLASAAELALPAAAARHVQVRRLQPGAALRLFDGRGGEWIATVIHMGRSEVRVAVGAHDAIERELPLAVTLAVGMPANERMDWLVEKATELGVAEVQPLQCERSVLRLDGERAARKVAHWQGVAVGAAEQSGRTRVPVVAPVRTLAAWLAGLPDERADARADAGADVRVDVRLDARKVSRLLLSLAPDTLSLPAVATGAHALCLLSGPEGGFDAAELAAARGAGFVPVSLGPRVLRADTAPLAALAWLALQAGDTCN